MVCTPSYMPSHPPPALLHCAVHTFFNSSNCSAPLAHRARSPSALPVLPPGRVLLRGGQLLHSFLQLRRALLRRLLLLLPPRRLRRLQPLTRTLRLLL